MSKCEILRQEVQKKVKSYYTNICLIKDLHKHEKKRNFVLLFGLFFVLFFCSFVAKFHIKNFCIEITTNYFNAFFLLFSEVIK